MDLQKQSDKKGVKLLLYLFIPLLVAFLTLYSYHSILSNSSYEKYPPMGELIDIGDYKLHMYALGEKSDLPTILLESGSGTPSSISDWRYIQPQLAESTRVISYDRAGYGWSEEAQNDRTSEQIIEDLHNMLEASGETGPFILVGHSFGGFNMQLFAHRYPEKVAGIVLIDSSIIGKSPKISNLSLFIPQTLRKIGVMRLLGDLGILPVPNAVISDKRSKQFLYRSFYNDDQKSELQLMTTSENQLKNVHLGDIPITILSSRAEEMEHEDWQEAQDNLLNLSTNSKRLIVEGASHYIHHDQPEVVTESILDIIEKTK